MKTADSVIIHMERNAAPGKMRKFISDEGDAICAEIDKVKSTMAILQENMRALLPRRGEA